MLAVVFRAERFHTNIYGWSFMIESDHKLLESISRKNLADTPAWLQCMMLWDMTSQSITTQARKWSYQICCLDSVPGQAPTFHWILLSIMPAQHQTAKKLSSKPSSMILKCKLLPTSSLLAGPRTSRKFLVPSAHTGNTDRLSL